MKLPFSRKRRLLFAQSTITCPKCLGAGKLDQDYVFIARYSKKRTVTRSCRLCEGSGRVFPVDAAQYLLTQD